METLISLLALAGMAYAAYRVLRWMLKAGQVQARGQEPLSPTDLKVLEESAARMTADLKDTADECVAKIEQVLARAENTIEALQTRSLPADLPGEELFHVAASRDADATRTPTLNTYVDSDAPAAAAAKSSGLTTGEVELIRDLRQLMTSV